MTQFYLADFRKKSFMLAVRFLENYLKAKPETIELGREDALAFNEVRDAVAVTLRAAGSDTR
jgi:hypothetical protein